jgi:hypothetical protein
MTPRQRGEVDRQYSVTGWVGKMKASLRAGRYPETMTREQRTQQASTLLGATLRKKRYSRYSPEWDHDHCAACWAKFAERDDPGILREGYATTAEYYLGEDYDWVCPRCFEDLHEEMGWRLVP